MLPAFCFNKPGTELEVLRVVEDDFCFHLVDYCRSENIETIVMDLETRYTMKYGVMDLLAMGYKIVVVHPNYSPITDKRVLPLDVHRDLETLHQHFPSSVCIGNLVIQLGLKRMLSKITCMEEEGETLNILPLKSIQGWKIISNIETELGFVLTEYHYRPTEIL